MFLEFSIISILALLSIAISFTPNVFMSLMFSVMLYINATLVLLLLGYEFLALVNILVYVGALAVLFIFVIMLCEIPAQELRSFYRGYSVYAALALISSKLVAPVLLNNLAVTQYSDISTRNFTFCMSSESINNIGIAFYVKYADILIFNSLILTIALLGALVLTQKQ